MDRGKARERAPETPPNLRKKREVQDAHLVNSCGWLHPLLQNKITKVGINFLIVLWNYFKFLAVLLNHKIDTGDTGQLRYRSSHLIPLIIHGTLTGDNEIVGKLL